MKTTNILAFIALFISILSCSKEDDPQLGLDKIAFEGSFSRDFEVMGTTQRATYTINQNQINYDLSGGFAQTNYDILKEFYDSKDNRWIGYRQSNNTYHVIFFKNTSKNEITLYKKEVASLEAGKNEPIPASDDTENHGWNTYTKNLPISRTIENLHAPQETDYNVSPPTTTGEFTKFDFATGTTTTSETNWDIAFRGTTIIVNGGSSFGATDEPERTGNGAAYIVNNTFAKVTQVETDKLIQDSQSSYAIPNGSGNGWYTYTGPPSHQIIPTAGKILVFRTRDEKYAKVEILSYYKDKDTSKESRYYTFNYVYQPNQDVKSF